MPGFGLLSGMRGEYPQEMSIPGILQRDVGECLVRF